MRIIFVYTTHIMCELQGIQPNNNNWKKNENLDTVRWVSEEKKKTVYNTLCVDRLESASSQADQNFIMFCTFSLLGRVVAGLQSFVLKLHFFFCEGDVQILRH